MQTRNKTWREERQQAEELLPPLSKSMRSCKQGSHPRAASGPCSPHFVSRRRICSLDESQVSATSEEKGLKSCPVSPGLVKMQTSTLRWMTSGTQCPCLRNPQSAAWSSGHLSRMHYLLCAKLCSNGFTYVIPFYLCNNPARLFVFSLPYRWRN